MIFSKKNKPHHSLLAVCDGKCVALSEMPDEAFASGMLGKGVAMEPTGQVFYSPADGTVDNVTESGHAYTICTEDGLDVLVHIGVDTVGLNGEGFSPTVSVGQRVRAGDELARADIDLIRARGYAATTAVLVTSPEKMQEIEYKYGDTAGGKDAIMEYCVSGKERSHV